LQCGLYLVYVSLDSDVRRCKHVTSQLDVADYRQSFVWTFSVDTHVTLTTPPAAAR